MMKKNQKQFKLLIIVIMLTLCTCMSKIVFAYTTTLPQVNLNSGGGPVEAPRYKTKEYDHGKRRFYCTYKDNMQRFRQISINAYDEQGRTIVPFTYISLVDFKAGTSINMNIREVKYATWNIDKEENKYYELLVERICTYKPDPTCSREGAACYGIKNVYEPNCNLVKDNATLYRSCLSSASEARAKKAACEKCKAECGTATNASVTSYNAYGKTKADIADTCPETTRSDEDGKDVTWKSCCTTVYDACHYDAEAPEYGGGIIKPEIYKEELEMTAPSVITQCMDIAKTDTSDIRAIPFVTTPSIEIEMINANDYNKKNLKIEKFSGYKLLIDKDFFETTTPRQTKKFEEDPYHFYTPKKFLEDFYDELKSAQRIKTMYDPELKKTKLPEDGYEIQANDEYHATYEYSPDRVCINRKTGEVNYDLYNNGAVEQNCYLSEEVKEVEKETYEDQYLDEKEVETWSYFIPLDTTTTTCESNDTGFFIAVSDRLKDPMGPEYCTSILEYLANNTGLLNYSDILLPVDGYGNTIGFRGDYAGNGESYDYNLFKKGGYNCIFSAKTRFNIDQKFYGEETKNNSLVIKGYGFYYRPIDYTKPFPNSVAVDSIWNGMYNEGTNTINNGVYTTRLKESFSTITYSTKEVSLQAVRQAAKKEKYTSWENMSTKTGLSEFVSDFNLRRSADLSRVYALGCGPDNLDWSGCS